MMRESALRFSLSVQIFIFLFTKNLQIDFCKTKTLTILSFESNHYKLKLKD
jgi:hypothetical protein